MEKREIKEEKILQERFTDRQSGLAYTVSVCLPLVVALIFSIILQTAASSLAKDSQSAEQVLQGFTQKNWYIYLSYLLNQAVFAGVIIFFLKKYRVGVKGGLMINKIAVADAGVLFIMSFAVLFGLSFINEYFLKLLHLLGYKQTSVPLPSMNNLGELIAVLLSVALIPALVEEALFRGVILSGLRDCKEWVAVILSGVLFSLFHQNPLQTPYQFVYGCILAFVALRTGSIFAPFILHFLNNATIIFMQYFSVTYSSTLEIIFTLSGVLLTAGGLVYFYFVKKKNEKEEIKSAKNFIIYASVGIVVCVLSWALNFFAGI